MQATKNILAYLHGAKSQAKNAKTILEAYNIFLENIIKEITKHTNYFKENEAKIQSRIRGNSHKSKMNKSSAYT